MFGVQVYFNTLTEIKIATLKVNGKFDLGKVRACFEVEYFLTTF